MESLIKRDYIEVTVSERGCITLSFSDSSEAMHTLAKELIEARLALIEAWADLFYRTGTLYFTKQDAIKKAIEKYDFEIASANSTKSQEPKEGS